MRMALILASLLISGCVNDSASYVINGNEHTLTVRAQQDWFWQDDVTLRLIASRLPDCQRQMTLGSVPSQGLNVEVFASGQDIYTLRAGNLAWHVDTRSCAPLAVPPSVAGPNLGVFRLQGDDLVFQKANTVAQ